MPLSPVENLLRTLPARSASVQLRHTLPDGTSHIDWMIDRETPHERPLVTFRLPRPLAALAPGIEHAIERIADHRRRYLTWEGEIGDGKGAVTRVADGELVVIGRAVDNVIELQWVDASGGWIDLTLRASIEGSWTVCTGEFHENAAQ